MEEIMTELLYADLSEKIRQAAFEVHQYFGTGFLEKVYENTLKYKLEKINLKVFQQYAIPVYFEEYQVGEYFADLLVEQEIILELKVTSTLTKIHFAQLKHYLKATGVRLGILINFGGSTLQFKRVIL
jgi:GxxExxY protein